MTGAPGLLLPWLGRGVYTIVMAGAVVGGGIGVAGRVVGTAVVKEYDGSGGGVPGGAVVRVAVSEGTATGAEVFGAGVEVCVATGSVVSVTGGLVAGGDTAGEADVAPGVFSNDAGMPEAECDTSGSTTAATRRIPAIPAMIQITAGKTGRAAGTGEFIGPRESLPSARDVPAAAGSVKDPPQDVQKLTGVPGRRAPQCGQKRRAMIVY